MTLQLTAWVCLFVCFKITLQVKKNKKNRGWCPFPNMNTPNSAYLRYPVACFCPYSSKIILQPSSLPVASKPLRC